jgi:hypothetical protein
MNDVAPVITVLLGILALKTVPSVRRKAPPAVTGFLAWRAIRGIPYIVQLMDDGGPIRLHGDGSDSAAVIGGYLGAGIVGCAVLFPWPGFCSTWPRDSGCAQRLQDAMMRHV